MGFLLVISTHKGHLKSAQECLMSSPVKNVLETQTLAEMASYIFKSFETQM